MTEGLAFEPAERGPEPDVIRVVGLVADTCGMHVAVGTERGYVVIGDADDILGLSWAFTQEQAEQLAQLIVRASWEAARPHPANERNSPHE